MLDIDINRVVIDSRDLIQGSEVGRRAYVIVMISTTVTEAVRGDVQDAHDGGFTAPRPGLAPTNWYHSLQTLAI